MSSLGWGDGLGRITIGNGLSATDANGLPLTTYDGTQPITLTSNGASTNYNLPTLFSGDYNDLKNKPLLLQGVPGNQGVPGLNGTNGTNGTNALAPSGSAGQVVYLASSGVAVASANFTINSSNITSSSPIYSTSSLA